MVEELRVQDPEAFREWKECIGDLMKVTNIASFVLSEPSNKILCNLRSTKARAADEPWSKEQTERLKAHLAILRDEARRDLGYAGPDGNPGTTEPITRPSPPYALLRPFTPTNRISTRLSSAAAIRLSSESECPS